MLESSITRLLKEIMNVLNMILMISLHVQIAVPRRRPQENEEEESAESFENLLYFQDCTKKKDERNEANEKSFTSPQIIVKEVAPHCQQCPAVCYSCCFSPPPAPVQNNQFPNIARSGLNNMGQNNGPSGISGAIPGAMPGSISGSGPGPITGTMQRAFNGLESPLGANNPWSQSPHRKSDANPLQNGPIQMLKKKKLKSMNVLNSLRRNGGNLKGLIEKDNDIKKILRDLVKVTIQKVDTLEKGRNHNENDDEFPSSEVIVVQDGEETNVNMGPNNGDENEE